MMCEDWDSSRLIIFVYFSFELSENLSFSNVDHNPDQPCHLKVIVVWCRELLDVQKKEEEADKESWDRYGGIESRFCPAG